MSTTVGAPSVYTQLAGQEIRNYLKSKLFWVGLGLLVLSAAGAPIGRLDKQSGGALDGLAPAAVIGVFGIVIMAGLVRKSDQAAEAAGAVAVPERTRTYALATAAVVPFAVGLIWFAVYVAAWFAYETDGTGPFGPNADSLTITTWFTEGVMATVGGPLLGLVIGRLIGQRWVAPVVAVLVVIVTILFQGGFLTSVDGFREVWIWTHFQGPTGIDDDDMRWVILPGSPSFHILYQVALCTLGVLSAAYHDRESDRRGLMQAAGVVCVVAVVSCGLSITGGSDGYVISPTPSSHAGNGDNGKLNVEG